MKHKTCIGRSERALLGRNVINVSVLLNKSLRPDVNGCVYSVWRRRMWRLRDGGVTNDKLQWGQGMCVSCESSNSSSLQEKY